MAKAEEIDIHYVAGLEHYQASRFEDAVREWRASAELDPEDAARHYNLGLALSAMELFDEAIKHLREAVRLQPDSFDALHWLITALIEELETRRDLNKSQWEEVRRLCDHALTLTESKHASQTWLLGERGRAEYELGRFRAAIATMRAVIDTAPDEPWAYETLQLLQFRTSDWIGSMRTTKTLYSLPTYDASSVIPGAECKRKLIAYALLAVGGVLLAARLRRSR